MSIFSKYCNCRLLQRNSFGAFAIGIVGMSLHKNQTVPHAVIQVSYGFAAIGLLGLGIHYAKVLKEKIDDYRRMSLFETLRPGLMRHLEEETRRALEYIKDKENMKYWNMVSDKLAERIAKFEKRRQRRIQAAEFGEHSRQYQPYRPILVRSKSADECLHCKRKRICDIWSFDKDLDCKRKSV